MRLLLLCVLLSIPVFFNVGLIEVRLDEIKYLLGKIDADTDVAQTLGIVAKYEIVKQRLLKGDSDMESMELEARIQALTSGNRLSVENKTLQQHIYQLPVKAVLQGIRLALGKEIVKPESENEILKVLEIAYFWERNRKYNEAIDLYDDVLANPTVTAEIKSAVLVHKAFCHSMLSEYDKAKELYELIISQFPDTEAGVLSWRLLEFINSMVQERQKLKRADLGRLEKTRQFFLLMDYRNAIREVSLLENSKNNYRQSELAEALYYKGRSYEELGEVEESIEVYRNIITRFKRNQWAKQANRRLLMVGEFYEQKKTIAEEAKRRLTEYQDKFFMDQLDQYVGLVSQHSLRDELIAQKAPEANVGQDSIIEFINKIGELDLTGEKKAEKKRQQREKLRQEVVSANKLPAAQQRELERRELLSQNPFRRPMAIKEVIDRNQVELRYLYNRLLRGGATVSGKIIVNITIKPDGTIQNPTLVRSELSNQEFEQQVLERIRDWKFEPVPENLGDLTVNYPFEFTRSF